MQMAAVAGHPTLGPTCSSLSTAMSLKRSQFSHWQDQILQCASLFLRLATWSAVPCGRAGGTAAEVAQTSGSAVSRVSKPALRQPAISRENAAASFAGSLLL